MVGPPVKTGSGARLPRPRPLPLRIHLVKHQRPQQSGFTPGKSTTDRILALRVLVERRRELRQGMLAAYVDLKKAFDSVHLIFAESLEVLVMALEALHEEAKPLGLEVSWLKTKSSKEGKREKCFMYDYNYTLVAALGYQGAAASAQDTPVLVPCYARTFNRSQYQSTVTTEWDLVCERRVLYSTTQAAVQVGKLVGYFFLGFLIDIFGRRKVVLVCSVFSIATSFGCAISSSVELYIFLRMAINVANSGVYLGTYVLPLRVLVERRREFRQGMLAAYVDLKKAFDSVHLIFAESLEVLMMALEALHGEAKPLGLEVSWLKTKVQVFGDLLGEAVQTCGTSMAKLSTKWAAGKGSAVLGRVAKTPAGLAQARSRAVRFNRVVDPGNIYAIREILPFESDFGNVGRGLMAAPGWDGVAVSCNGIIILSQKVKEDIRAVGPFGVIDWAKTREDGNCSSSGVKSYVGRDAEGVAIEVCKVEQCGSLGLGVNSHQAGPVGVGTECNLANLPLEACRETLLPESPRWLIAQGRHPEALQVLKGAARVNRRPLPPDPSLLAAMQRLYSKVANETDGASAVKTKEASRCGFAAQWVAGMVKDYLSVVLVKELRPRVLVVFFCWFAAALVYYGVSLNATNISVNVYLYAFIGGVLEVPSYVLLWPLIAYLGRVKALVLLYLTCTFAILILALFIFFYPDAPSGLIMFFSLSGKMAITAALTLIWMFTSELFPTKYRSRVTGQASVAARVGSISSPYINDILGELVVWAPSAVFCIISFLAAGLSYLLPETKGRGMPEGCIIEDETNTGGSVNQAYLTDTESQFKEIPINSRNSDASQLDIKKDSMEVTDTAI
ncbi:Organic cation transporter protein [Chionoecetes opilio]|uniref:Organic cation transporter protein n=1 Tax=Chionoecetes opilio TaxID=41210 RepID=A0A8J4YGP2_CHIOP|nr:Organic cation transporter protein [Chionoecetes opilio]